MTEICILTIRQPFAWAIIHGGKDVENRTRNIAGAYRGPVAIHAAKVASDFCDWRVVEDGDGTRRLSNSAKSDGEAFHVPQPRGIIIGVVDLTGVHEPGMSWEDDESGRCSDWASGGMFHLVLANPRPLPEPIPWKGAQGLRRLDSSIVPGLEALL